MAINQITDFLNTKLIDNKFIFINVWTIVHLITGFLLMKYFLNYLSHLFLLLVLWEAFEIVVGQPFFKKESGLDIFWDISLGMAGGLIYLKWF